MITTTATGTTIMYGENSALRLGLKAKELGITKAMLITDEGIYSTGIVDPMIENMKKLDIEVILYTGVLPDPPDTMVNEAGAIAQEEKIDGIIAVGGGSSIDTGKAVNALVKTSLPINQWFSPNVAIGEKVPLIVIPTTAGTGSECTAGGVVTETATGQKKAFTSPDGYPALVIVDPLLYVGMPVKPSVYCAFDVITHAIDAICHGAAEPLASAYGEKALRMAYRNLPKIIKNPKDIKARGAMAFAATLGGAAINGNMCHLTHVVGHSLGSAFHLPHGLGCVIALPELIKYYAEWMPDKVYLVAENIGLDLPEDLSSEELGKIVSDTILEFMKETGVPTLKELDISLEDVMNKALPMMMKDFTFAFAPRMIGPSKLKEIMEVSYAQ